MSWDDIAIVTAEKTALHFVQFPRPSLEAYESPIRVQMAERHLRERGILQQMKQYRAQKARTEDIMSVHSPHLVDTVRLMTELGSGEIGESAYASPGLLDAALLSAGGAIQAAEIVVQGRNRHAFALVRPPGHHASTSNAMGLCYFNNVAVAVRRAFTKEPVNRVTILDIDDHYGNGTAEIFYSDKNVQYISIHEYDYDNNGLGHFGEMGHGDAIGTKINIPLLESSPDESYASALRRIVVPAIKSFRPNIIAVSAGFDAHYQDPVGNMNIDSSTFWLVGDTIRRLVDSVDAIGSFWVLEGGYNPATLGLCIESSLTGLAGLECPHYPDQIPREIDSELLSANNDIIDRVIEAIQVYL